VEKRGTVGQAKDTHPHTEYVTFIAFPLHQRSHEPAWVCYDLRTLRVFNIARTVHDTKH